VSQARCGASDTRVRELALKKSLLTCDLPAAYGSCAEIEQTQDARDALTPRTQGTPYQNAKNREG
jgi:hypothetical protein